MARTWISLTSGCAVVAALVLLVSLSFGSPQGAVAIGAVIKDASANYASASTDDAAGEEGKAAAPGDAASGDKGYQLVAPLQAVMYASEDVFNSIKDLLKEGKYLKIQRNAYLLAELANVYGHATGEATWGTKEWKDLSSKLEAEFIKLAKAAKAKNEAEVKSLWSTIEATCGTCHEKIRDA